LKKMSNVTGLRCVHCAREFSAAEVDYFCPACGYADGILDVLYDYEAVKREMSPAALAANPDLSIWRYRPLLPVMTQQLCRPCRLADSSLRRIAAGFEVGRCAMLGQG